jgi:DNA polymerase-3 subunit epsilon
VSGLPSLELLAARPDSTLVDRALLAIARESRPARWLAVNVLGIERAPDLIAERLAVALLGADPRVQRLANGTWALVAGAGAPLLEECAFAVIDVETTGGSAAGSDRIIEVAVVLVQGERRELVFDSLVNPGRAIPGVVTSITGITSDMVRSAPAFEEIAEPLLDVLAGRVFVAHNARFDWRFVATELKRARALRLEGARLCTVRLARRLVDAVESCALDALTFRFDLTNPARHRAAGDAQATAELLQRLLRLARQEGARTLNDLELLQGRGARKRRARRRPRPPGGIH